ncbi:ABC-type glycerol-3-phosphate transport system permease component [Arthrobacter sp. B3I9]|uniref:carbohydrate ABC transporter permease n=1 Tax=Arthrobacter sp. B3I9 TaxID=3042270 RepID=UPI00278FF867|nr:carbohydrate ABC transporter permease [Arthrobacter sp. B3I9]MDQ0851701.1 ABC-type glycerol-3-phosphate transport system permease component [Arthrobacter sp. B3I9]
MSVRRRSINWNVGVRAAVAVICTFLFIAPVLWMVTTAFKTGNQAFSGEIQWFFTPTLENFAEVLGGTRLTYALINSLQVSVISSIVAILLASGIAYPLARYEFRGRDQIAGTILSLRIVPPIVTIIPLFLVMRTVGLNGSLLSIIILHVFMNLPLAVWLLRGFYEDVPKEIEEAGAIDGLGSVGIFFRMVLPLAMPGVASTALLCFVFSWNEFLFASVLSNAGSQTVTVALTQYVTPVGTEWTLIMAAGTVVAVPVWLAALAAQKYLVRGLSLGAVK